MNLSRLLPLPPLGKVSASQMPREAMAAVAVVFLGVPQGMAYATIAELPPVVGLYAAALPAIVGSLFRSSRHVVTGPTNALSLLVGGAIAAGVSDDPVSAAVTMAFLVGVFQIAAGVLRLGTIVDFISNSVVLGYITGAGVLIGLGQLYNVVGTEGPRGRIWITLGGFVDTLPGTAPIAVVVSLGTVALVVLLRALKSKLPGAIVATVVAIVVNVVFDLESLGLKVVRDIGSVPAQLPPLTLPDFSNMGPLIPVALACTVLSLIESYSVARSIASRTGQRLDASVEFTGQGLANLAASFFGGYPCSGSLSRSALNERGGAQTRVSGMLTGAMMIVVLLVAGPVLDRTPVAALAGLLLVVAWDLIDRDRIRATWGAGWPDRVAFAATVLGTWLLPLDQAIYLGVGLSVVLFLRRARLLQVVELFINDEGTVREGKPGQPPDGFRACRRVRVIQVTGPLFFAATGPLLETLEQITDHDEVEVLILRLRRATGLDATCALGLGSLAKRLRAAGKSLALIGLDPADLDVLRGTGVATDLGEKNIYASRTEWFKNLASALADKGAHLAHDGCDACPFVHLNERGLVAPKLLPTSPEKQ